MSKLKTKKGVAKRFKLTKNKKVAYHPGGKSHLLTGKEPERLRTLRRSDTIQNKKFANFLRSMLPYG